MNPNKKMLTINDLINFYEKHPNFSIFSSEKSGYQIAVQVPMQFDSQDEGLSDDGLLHFYSTWAWHLQKNRNGSAVFKNGTDRAMKNLAYKPILADFVEWTDKNTGEKMTDFTSHIFAVLENGEVDYKEHQIGCFTTDEPYYEEADGKTYVRARIAIPDQYTKANEIIQRRSGTKSSVELFINECSYNYETKTLELTNYDVMGMTCLGVKVDADGNVVFDKKGNPIMVEEGMEGANISLQDFSTENNSFFSSINEETNQKLIDTLNELNATLKSFDNTSIQKGGKDKNMFNRELFESLLVKYSVTTEQVEFEYENLNDEELEAAFAENFDESKKDNGSTEPSDPVEPEIDPVTEPEDEPTPTEPDGGEDPESNPEDGEGEGDDGDGSDDGTTEYEKHSIEFELSHDDIRNSLYNLLSVSYEDSWYGIQCVYDDSFIFYDYFTGQYWGQKYSKNETSVTLEGERYELHAEFLTNSELEELKEMRTSYASLAEFKQNYDLEASRAEKREVLSAECYSSIAEKAEFVELMKDENLDKYSKEEIQGEADKICGKYARLGQFSLNDDHKEPEKPKKSVVVTMFGAQKHESSFLEGLRDMYKVN